MRKEEFIDAVIKEKYEQGIIVEEQNQEMCPDIIIQPKSVLLGDGKCGEINVGFAEKPPRKLITLNRYRREVVTGLQILGRYVNIATEKNIQHGMG